jgi:environmental stress-induced protein Ves
MPIVRYADVPDTPWPNGAGSTRLLWSDSPGERRVSVAMLERPAPFSTLRRAARLLWVLDPVVVELRIGATHRTLRQRESIAFAGDDPVAVTSLDRPGRVVNLICDADRWTPSIDPSPVAPLGWITVPEGDLMPGTHPARRAVAIRFLPVDRRPTIP